MIKLLLLIIYSLSFLYNLRANNIQLSNISLVGQDPTSNFTMIQFDITWENSWKVNTGPTNWDAAWIFAKYRIGSGPWLHAFLNNSGHSIGSGTTSTISPGLLNTEDAFNTITNPAIGVFVYRSSEGSGTFSQNGIQLRWNYGSNSISDNEVVEIKLFAIEMVYVPQGSFKLGDGTSTNIFGQFRDGAVNSPFTISSENALTLGGTSSGNLANNNGLNMESGDDFDNSTTKTLPVNFPKGYNGFYCMKYEVTQQQWIDFFNTLDDTQKENRDITGGILNSTGKGTDLKTYRNNIYWVSGDASLNDGTHGSVACNFLSWMDGAAFADWAGLRPMTEMEYEKACRGSLSAVANEFAWGSTVINAAYTILNSGSINETLSSADANSAFYYNASEQGPLRVGIFATSSSTREKAGASYYGIMELSGNLWERTVSVGNSVGRNFTRQEHGNGVLSLNGFCDISTWPGYNLGEVKFAGGSSFRGGTWTDGTDQLRISDRKLASLIRSGRLVDYGFRAVRSVP